MNIRKLTNVSRTHSSNTLVDLHFNGDTQCLPLYRYDKNGKVDRKAECDSHFSDGYTVLKSSMVGTVYYAAVRKESTGDVFAAVTLTSSDKDFNFGYKGMDESCGPNECKCPLSILKLLTPTEYEWAQQWRQHCYNYHSRDKGQTLNSILTPGSKYLVWGKYEATFIGFRKRTAIFQMPDGSRTRFTGLKPNHVKEVA